MQEIKSKGQGPKGSKVVAISLTRWVVLVNVLGNVKVQRKVIKGHKQTGIKGKLSPARACCFPYA